eukprot:CAMPEP_0176262298 /NCGR_PEP_ID=MMETSP0121_2-20121125/40537_1 /TAXON_ID=160619 /ORGANISM="Kryptoperidinium foliaceum, Strain CCMP 1326" /LENGTH=303 /DNA_ID=CAMNT_0017602257 /DNA_START=251 /DNA_END=1159 /DNA_ORIENTATION=-
MIPSCTLSNTSIRLRRVGFAAPLLGAQRERAFGRPLAPGKTENPPTLQRTAAAYDVIYADDADPGALQQTIVLHAVRLRRVRREAGGVMPGALRIASAMHRVHLRGVRQEAADANDGSLQIVRALQVVGTRCVRRSVDHGAMRAEIALRNVGGDVCNATPLPSTSIRFDLDTYSAKTLSMPATLWHISCCTSLCCTYVSTGLHARKLLVNQFMRLHAPANPPRKVMVPRLNQLLCALVVYLRHHVPAAVVDLRLRVRLRRVLQLHVLRRSVAPAATARELRGGNLRPWVKGATVALAVERGLT